MEIRKYSIFILIMSFVSCNSDIAVDIASGDRISTSGETDPVVPETPVTPETYLVAKGDFTGLEFHGLQVDWARKLIYGGNSGGTKCFSVFSYSDPENISLVSELSSTSTPAMEYSTCRNLFLYDNGTKILSSSNNSQRITRYDMGLTPEDPLTWAASPPSFNISAGSWSRAISQVSTNGVTSQIYVATHRGWVHLELTEGTDTFVEQARYTGSSSNNTAIFDIASGLVLSRRYSSTTADIIVTDLATGNVSATFGGSLPDANGISSVPWTSVTSDDGQKHVLLGHALIFIDSAGALPTIVRRERMDSGRLFRQAKFVSHNGSDYVYAVTNTHVLDVYNIDDISNPILESQTTITELGDFESYGMDVNLDENLAIIGTNKGIVVLVDTEKLTAATKQNIFIPEVSVADNSVYEGSALDITISLDNPTTETVTVDWATMDGTAVTPGDYTASGGTVTFLAGETSKVVNIPLVVDGAGEGPETLQVILSSPSGVVIVDDTSDIIVDDTTS